MIYMIKAAIVIEAILLVAVVVFRTCLLPRHRHIVAAGDIPLIVLIPLVGLFGYDKSVFYGFLFVAPLFWAGDPTALAKRYVLALVSFPDLASPITIGGHYFGTWSAVLSLDAGALVALVITRRGGLKPVRSVDVAVWLIFLGALLMSSRGAGFVSTLRPTLTTFFLVMAPYIVVSRALGSAKATADTVAFLVLGGVCNACIAIVEAAKHWALYESIAGALHVQIRLMSANLAVRAGFLRAGGAFVNYEFLGLLCGMALVTAIALRRRFTAGGFAVVVVLLVTGLLASQARSAWIATAAGLLLQAIYNRRWAWASAFVGGLGLVAALALTFASHGGTTAQLIGTSGHGQGSTEYRQRLLDRGIEEAREHPWSGQSLDDLQVSMNDLRQGEHIIDFVNVHLNILLVGGFGALLVWLSAWCIPLIAAWRHRPPGGRSLEPPPTALPFALIAVIMLFLAFTSAIDRAYPLAAVSMGLMSVGLALSAPARRRVGAGRPLAAAAQSQPV